MPSRPPRGRREAKGRQPRTWVRWAWCRRRGSPILSGERLPKPSPEALSVWASAGFKLVRVRITEVVRPTPRGREGR